MSGPVYYCSWWLCRGTKLIPHDNTICPHMAHPMRKVPAGVTRSAVRRG